MVGEIIAQAIALLSQGGAPVWAVVLLALASAVLIVVGRKIGSLKLPPPEPENVPPDAVWNTDPASGAVVVPNDDPGGCGPGGSCAG